MNELSVTTFPTVGKPDASWSLDQLGECAKYHEDQAVEADRQTAIHRFRQGHVLTLAHEKVPYGQWGKFLAKHRISTSSDDRARELYEKAKSEDRLKGMGINEAYKKFRIGKPKRGETWAAKVLKTLPPLPQKVDMEDLPEDLPGLTAACQKVKTEMQEARTRLEAPTASTEDRTRHSVLLRQWLMLCHKQDQAKARQEHQERLRVAEQRRLEAAESIGAEAVKLLVLLEESCRVMAELHKVTRSVDPKLTEREEFSKLSQRFTELAEDLTLRLIPA